MRPHHRTRDWARERGSVSLFAVVLAVAMIVVIGLVVDGGAKIHAQQHAQAVADPYTARAAAQAYLTAAGLPGTVTVTDGTRLRVEATATYEPMFLGIVGAGTQTVTAHAEARLVRAVGGTER